MRWDVIKKIVRFHQNQIIENCNRETLERDLHQNRGQQLKKEVKADEKGEQEKILIFHIKLLPRRQLYPCKILALTSSSICVNDKDENETNSVTADSEKNQVQ